MSFDKRALRNTLGRFATGICVVSAMGRDGRPVGLTINSFTSVSLEPPLVLFCLDNRSESLGAFLDSSGFALAILSDRQRAVSHAFASAPAAARWDGVPFEIWESGAPVIPDALGVIDCARHATHDGGDHTIIVGRVLRFANGEGRPLLYYGGGYAGLHVNTEI